MTAAEPKPPWFAHQLKKEQIKVKGTVNFATQVVKGEAWRLCRDLGMIEKSPS